MKSDFDINGYHLIKRFFNDTTVTQLISALSVFDNDINNYGIRDLMNKVPKIRELAYSDPLLGIVRQLIGDKARPIRSVFFDKVPQANWNVAWHQDTSIAIKERHAVDGFDRWSEKQGVAHVEPPVEYLSNILTLRVHLDQANKDTGVLRVIPGTHRNGRRNSHEILDIVDKSVIVDCNADPGDVLLMSPLLFHSSRKAVTPSHRRIVHIEYSAMDLPEPLQWYESA